MHKTLTTIVVGIVLCGLPALAQDGFVCAGGGDPSLDVPPPGGAAKITQSSTEGTGHAIAIFARFRGENPRETPVPSWADAIFDAERPGSFSHFYASMSFGKLQVTGEVAPRTYVSRAESSFYLASNDTARGGYGRFAEEILREVDEDTDFSRFDNDGPDGIPNSGDDDGAVDAVFIIMASVPEGFIAAGATGVGNLGWEEPLVTDDYGASGQIVIQPRQGTLQRGRTSTEAIGSMCHEYGHVLGLPDLYNTDYLRDPSAPPEEDSAGIGAWGLMGWGAAGWNGDDGPNSFCAWSRMRLGWTLVGDAQGQEETLRLGDVGRRGEVYRVPFAAHEYFLLEYRSPESSHYDRHIPGEGLLIWHVRRGLVTQGEANRWFVDLECADGRWLEAGHPLGQTPRPEDGGDNLDFWAHNEEYREAHAGNLGDATDPFDGEQYRSFTPETNPGATAAQAGQILRVEEIEVGGGLAWARVHTTPLLLTLEGLNARDQSGDGMAVSGEGVIVRFVVANQGGLRAEDVTVSVYADDPLVEIINESTSYRGLDTEEQTLGGGSRGFPVIAFSDQFVGTHETEMVLVTHANGILVNEHRLRVSGVSAQQAVRGVTVVDSCGNGDGRVQASEIFSLTLKLGIENPELLEPFAFSLRPVEPDVEQLSGTGLGLRRGEGVMWIAQSQEFLTPSGLTPGQSLGFELEVRSAYASWRDTLTVEVAPGPDKTAPRVLGLHARPAPGGVRIIVPSSRFVEGDAVASATALVYDGLDSSKVMSVPLEWRDNRYEGTWHTQALGTFLIAAELTDRSGNVGLGPVVPFPITTAADAGAEASGMWDMLPLCPRGQPALLTNLVFAPSDPGVVYGVSQHSIWQSLDAGHTWRRAGLMTSGAALDLWVDSVDPTRVYVHSSDGRTLRGDDGGRRWRVLELPEGAMLLSTDQARSDVVYAGSEQGMWVSADGGTSWDQLTGESTSFALVHPLEPGLIFSGTGPWWDAAAAITRPGHLLRSADGGTTWEVLDRAFEALHADPGDRGGLYGISVKELWHSADHGDHWTSLGSPPGARDGAWSIHPHRAAPGLIFAWHAMGGPVSRSLDGGVSWEEISLPADLPRGRSGATVPFVDPSDPERLLLLGMSWSQYSLVQGQDAGETWREVRVPTTGSPAGTVVFDEAGRIYVGSSRREGNAAGSPAIYLSDDGGTTWTWRTDPSMTRAHAALSPVIGGLRQDPEASDLLLAHTFYASVRYPGIRFAVGSGGEFMRSADSGRSWNKMLDTRSWGFYSHPAILSGAGIHWLAGERVGIRTSQDGGTSWELRDEGMPRGGQGGPPDVLSLAMDPDDPDVLYAGLHDGLWVTFDNGREWHFMESPFEETRIVHLAFHPLEDATLYAVTPGALYVSRDRATTWSTVLALSPAAAYPLRLRFHPRDEKVMYLVLGDRLLATRDGGASWTSLADRLAPGPWVSDVAIDPYDPESLYAATPWGVYRTNLGRMGTAIEDEEDAAPERFGLERSYPNPFNSSTVIPFAVDRDGYTELAVYDLLGQRVRNLVRERVEAGDHTVLWDGCGHDGKPLASGVYLCRLQSGPVVALSKLLLLK